jgi:tetratricopeptide (TPR) repeat protein
MSMPGPVRGTASADARSLHDEGVALQRAGRHDAALASYRRALEIDPTRAATHFNLGVALMFLGRTADACDAYRQSLRFAPGHAGAHSNLGLLLSRAGENDEAEEHYRAALAADPQFLQARLNLANLLASAGRLGEAEAHYRSIVAAFPERGDVWNNLGSLLAGQMRLEPALGCFGHAITLDPRAPQAHTNRGSALAMLGRLDDARDALAQALALDPRNADALATLGNVAVAELALDAAVDAYQRALALRPEHASARLGRALVRLVRGDLGEAWADYEARLPSSNASAHGVARWRGEPLPAGTVLVHAEQGLGDTLHFARYLPLVRERVASVVFEVQPQVMRLAGPAFTGVRVIAVGDPRPPHDAVAPLLSLPGIFGTTLASIPGTAPYLASDPMRHAAWAHRLAPRRGLRVGLVWAGNPGHRNDRNRSLPPALLGALDEVPGVQWYSLQKPDGLAASLPASLGAIDLAGMLGDFADTAAALAHLDLVVTVDTSVAHLAGALGREAWVLLPHSPDWRWLLERSDSPWYPSLRLFRQQERGAWEPVIAAVAQALRARIVSTTSP